MQELTEKRVREIVREEIGEYHKQHFTYLPHMSGLEKTNMSRRRSRLNKRNTQLLKGSDTLITECDSKG